MSLCCELILHWSTSYLNHKITAVFNWHTILTIWLTVIIITMAVPSACYMKIYTLLYKKKTLFLLCYLCVETVRWTSYTACSFHISEMFIMAHSCSRFATSQILGTDCRKFWKHDCNPYVTESNKWNPS